MDSVAIFFFNTLQCDLLPHNQPIPGMASQLLQALKIFYSIQLYYILFYYIIAYYTQLYYIIFYYSLRRCVLCFFSVRRGEAFEARDLAVQGVPVSLCQSCNACVSPASYIYIYIYI